MVTVEITYQLRCQLGLVDEGLANFDLQVSLISALNNAAAFATKRFTLFHKAFHILAHCRTTPVFRKRGSVVGSFNEFLAEYFTTCILMPREWMVEKWAQVRDLDRMAEIFDVPKSAVCIRLRRLGLI